MFPRWSPQFHFLNSSGPEWVLLIRISIGILFTKVSLLLSTVKMDQWQTSPVLCPSHFPFSCARFNPPDTDYLVLLLTGLWRSTLPLLKPCLLSHETLEPLLFYECVMPRFEWYPCEKIVNLSRLLLHNMRWAFTHDTLRDQSITSRLARWSICLLLMCVL